ncbi:hypothetical protein K4A83_16740 [Spirulina subsalsa FACHB-351]|uniref:Uncharacterized protein n=1 Tax=Spirulina subsalsa FACHB-351 TaxID=234711 RepID=A0ABT3L8S0_9CYAN|nr:hypothetical protein [Spirulina subsalsa]MCW6037908.1 hypothetical protein [Spirulina subsalsa FACHB-351]
MTSAIRAYFQAVELEADYEAIYYDVLDVKGQTQDIPHFILLLDYIKKYQILIDLFLPFCKIFFGLIIAPFYFLIRAVLMARLLLINQSRITLEKKSSVYLATSNGENLRYLPKNYLNFPDLIITTSFKGIIDSSVLPSTTCLSLTNICDFQKLIKAYCLAVLSTWKLTFSSHRKYVLWGYTAFEWYLTFLTVCSIHPKRVWISNQNDRWLILATSIPNAKVNIVQHGRLFTSLENGDKIFYRREQKLKNIDSIFAVDLLSEKLFGEYIDVNKVCFERINPRLASMPWRQTAAYTFKILVIGGSHKLGFFLKLMKEISHTLSVPYDLAIRHHPLQKSRIKELDKNTNVWELSHSDPIPEADLVVSYGSSVDDQIYLSIDTNFVTYQWSDCIDVHQIALRVKDTLTNINRLI